jgi:hypothetical protein
MLWLARVRSDLIGPLRVLAEHDYWIRGQVARGCQPYACVNLVNGRVSADRAHGPF